MIERFRSVALGAAQEAGSLILQEAGGTIHNLGRSGCDMLRTGAVASNRAVQEAPLGLV